MIFSTIANLSREEAVLNGLGSYSHILEQVQIASWSILQVSKPNHTIYVRYTDETRTMPAYYCVLSSSGTGSTTTHKKRARGAGPVTLVSIWRSVESTLALSAPPQGGAMGLLRYALCDAIDGEGDLISTEARIGFIQLCKRNGIPLQMVGTLPKHVQGATIPVQFKKSDFIRSADSGSTSGPG